MTTKRVAPKPRGDEYDKAREESKMLLDTKEMEDVITNPWTNIVYLWPMLFFSLMCVLVGLSFAMLAGQDLTGTVASHHVCRYWAIYHDNATSTYPAVEQHQVLEAQCYDLAIHAYVYTLNALLAVGFFVLILFEGGAGRLPVFRQCFSTKSADLFKFMVEPHLFMWVIRGLVFGYLLSCQFYDHGEKGELLHYFLISFGGFGMAYFFYASDAFTHKAMIGKLDPSDSDVKTLTFAAGVYPLIFSLGFAYYLGIGWSDYYARNHLLITDVNSPGFAKQVFTFDVMIIVGLMMDVVILFGKSVYNICKNGVTIKEMNPRLNFDVQREGAEHNEFPSDAEKLSHALFMVSLSYWMALYCYHTWVLFVQTNGWTTGPR